jgi:hypothetical protein
MSDKLAMFKKFDKKITTDNYLEQVYNVFLDNILLDIPETFSFLQKVTEIEDNILTKKIS